MNIQKAQELMNQNKAKFGLFDWTFTFDRALNRNGVCKYRTKTISLSKFFVELNEEPKILNTILHEIAHALLPPEHGHNRIWKRKAIEIGCSPERLSIPLVKVPSKYIYACLNCSFEKGFNRTIKIACACAECCNKYNNGAYDIKYILKPKVI